MTFDDVLEQVVTLLKRQGRVSYGALKRRFDLDDAYLEDLKGEILYVHESDVEADERGFTWTGATEDLQGTTSQFDRTEPQSAVEQTPTAQAISVPAEPRPPEAGRCFKAVDSMSDEEPKLIAIDEEANHQIVHGDRFGKANGATYKPFNPGPQIDVLAFDSLRILLSYRVLLWVDMPLVRPPSIG
jgi:hypothetical protein